AMVNAPHHIVQPFDAVGWRTPLSPHAATGPAEPAHGRARRAPAPGRQAGHNAIMSESDFVPAHVDPGGPSIVWDLGAVQIRKASVSAQDNNAYLITDVSAGASLLIDAAD